VSGHPTAPARTVLARLAERAIPHEVLTVGEDAVVIVSSYGGRVYGPFFGDGASVTWTPRAFESADAFAALVDSGIWNVGGERVWIGPEIAFMIPDRSRYWDSYAMPPSMDPGTHALSRDGDTVLLERTMTLTSFVEPRGETTVTVEIRIRPAADPRRHLRGDRPEEPLRYAGYSSEVTLRHRGESGMHAEAWNLVQVQAGGVALVSTVPHPQVTDYYEPVGPLLAAVAGGIAVRLTGADRFKLGFAAPHTFGRVGHVAPLADGRARYLLRNSLSDPSAEYSEEPDFAPGWRGDPIHLYDDDGGLGGFAELEARGLPVAATPAGDASSVDAVTTWCFEGPADEIARTAIGLGGIDPRAASSAFASSSTPTGTE
jgi:hypothetical protein